jgi:hypothetical protein
MGENMRLRKFKKPSANTPASPRNIPPAVDQVLNSSGHSLDAATQTSMETRFGHDFSAVRVHTDSTAAESAKSVNALAYTIGNDIAFGEGEYRPGTLIGDSLIAHELAHVLQQNSGDQSSLTANFETNLDDSHMERQANFSMLSTIASYLSQASTRFADMKQNTLSGMRTGLRLQRCSRATPIQTPSFFGRYSRETLNQINSRMEAGASLQNWLAFGQIMATAEVEGGGIFAALDTAEAAEALRAIPGIVRARAREDIDFLFLEHENELNSQEREFWTKLRSKL